MIDELSEEVIDERLGKCFEQCDVASERNLRGKHGGENNVDDFCRAGRKDKVAERRRRGRRFHEILQNSLQTF